MVSGSVLNQGFEKGESKKNPVGVSLVCDLNNSNKDQVYVILESMWPPSMKHDRPSIFYFALLAFSFFFSEMVTVWAWMDFRRPINRRVDLESSSVPSVVYRLSANNIIHTS